MTNVVEFVPRARIFGLIENRCAEVADWLDLFYQDAEKTRLKVQGAKTTGKVIEYYTAWLGRYLRAQVPPRTIVRVMEDVVPSDRRRDYSNLIDAMGLMTASANNTSLWLHLPHHKNTQLAAVRNLLAFKQATDASLVFLWNVAGNASKGATS